MLPMWIGCRFLGLVNQLITMWRNSHLQLPIPVPPTSATPHDIASRVSNRSTTLPYLGESRYSVAASTRSERCDATT